MPSPNKTLLDQLASMMKAYGDTFKYDKTAEHDKYCRRKSQSVVKSHFVTDARRQNAECHKVAQRIYLDTEQLFLVCSVLFMPCHLSVKQVAYSRNKQAQDSYCFTTFKDLSYTYHSRAKAQVSKDYGIIIKPDHIFTLFLVFLFLDHLHLIRDSYFRLRRIFSLVGGLSVFFYIQQMCKQRYKSEVPLSA